MKLIVISSPVDLNNEHELLGSLFETGLGCFHLRKPEYSEMQMEAYLQSVPGKYHKKIMLHAHYPLAEKYNLKGIHHTKTIPGYFKEGLTVSASVHSIKEIEESKKYDYVFLSPLFDSISKPGYTGNFDFGELKNFLQRLKMQHSHPEVIALSGIDENNITIAHETGFDGVAVLGSIWGTFLKNKNIQDTIIKFHKIQEQCRFPVHTY